MCEIQLILHFFFYRRLQFGQKITEMYSDTGISFTSRMAKDVELILIFVKENRQLAKREFDLCIIQMSKIY